MFRGILSWLGEKAGEARKARSGGRVSVELLEPRVLLSADLAGVQPVLCYETIPVDHAVYVDLDQQDAKGREESSPILTLDASPYEQVSQTPTGQEDASSSQSQQAQPGAPAVELFGISPALFVENQGQWSDASVRYVHDGDGVDVAMTDAGVLFRATDADTQMLQFSVSFVGANLVQPIGLDRSETLFNYYAGDQVHWRQHVPSYELVAYEGLYEGIDLRVQGLRSHVKYEFHVAPGADYRQIAVQYEGIEGLSLAQDGSLQVNLGAGRGVIRDDAPYIYQEIDGQRVTVAGRFVLLDDRTYSFEITGTIDLDHALVIDPDLVWSTYLGGSNGRIGAEADVGNGIAVDAEGNVYVAGWTEVYGWTSGGFNTTYNGGAFLNDVGDAFVAKLSSDGAHLWSTYLGGTDYESGLSIAVDASGNVYVTGFTYSLSWTSGGFDTTYNGGLSDAFVTKLSSGGGHLWDTYLGGSGEDQGTGIAVDGTSGNICVTGLTRSSGWTSGGFGTTYNGGFADVFVAQLSSDGAHVWSTYLGGNGEDGGEGVAVDASGNVYVTGKTASSSWTSGGFDTTYNGGSNDAFVTKLNSGGGHVWDTYLGGSGNDWAEGIAVDASGNVYVTGQTASSGWVSGGFDTTYNGGDGSGDAFVAKLDSEGAHLWSTYLGGGDQDKGYGIGVDTSGNAYATGYTLSSGWTSGGFDTSYDGYDAFVAELSTTGQHVWSTYLGRTDADIGYGIAVAASSEIHVAGFTYSADWTSGGFDTTYNGGGDVFVAKFAETMPPSPDPSTWATEPHATGSTSVRMVATAAADVNGVEYYFREIGGNPGATDSGWQDSNMYEDTGLVPGTTYTYQVRTRDRSINHNETQPADPRSATTDADTTAPTPNPSTWATAPHGTGPHSISMAATAAADPSGVEYYFDEMSGNPGATDSGWQDSNVYEDTSLSPGMLYIYEVKTRDRSANHNEGAYSASASAATASPVYRFWKQSDNTHFYTIKESERLKLIANYSNVYTDEGVAYYAYVKDLPPAGTLPVYRFWKASDNTHFYTIKESERLKLMNDYSSIYTFEGVAYYAFLPGQQPAGTLPVYRFWKPLGNTHFFTIKESEKDKLINLFSSVFTFENTVWYAYVV